MDAHIFQEYTYKKITPCDICSQILRGRYNGYIHYYMLHHNYILVIIGLSENSEFPVFRAHQTGHEVQVVPHEHPP